MKTIALPFVLAFATGSFAFAQAAAPEAARRADAIRKPVRTHKLDAEIVTADVESKTVTFKTTAGEKSVPVGPLAMYRLKRVKAGDKVTLTCKDGATAGECAEVAFIKQAQAPAPETQP